MGEEDKAFKQRKRGTKETQGGARSKGHGKSPLAKSGIKKCGKGMPGWLSG
ncbi:unnamed protein product [Nyctereutes procyonoides]|uniref:(raccoon dog) hypothetical protein n=1 Tax=Nyctereutes procyonoides TaxID=34880 RepID=A0A811ZCL6_NYCPR|nr:unnamed protein product [Nyctereutes procyonoides]